MSVTLAGRGFLGEHRCVLIFSSKSFPAMAPETSKNSNAVETHLVSTPFGIYRCIRLEPDLDGLKMLVDSSTGSLRRKFTGVSSPGAKPDKVARCQRPLHAHESRKLIFFLVRSLRPGQSLDLGPEVDHVRSTLKGHFPLHYRSTCPCPMCSFTFWFSVSSLEASVYFYVCIFVRISFQLVVH